MAQFEQWFELDSVTFPRSHGVFSQAASLADADIIVPTTAAWLSAYTTGTGKWVRRAIALAALAPAMAPTTMERPPMAARTAER